MISEHLLKAFQDHFSNKNSKDLFNAVRKGMNLKPVKEWKHHVELNTISENRELYVAGVLYKEGDQVIIKETNEVVEIALVVDLTIL